MIHSGAGPARFDDPARLADTIVEKVGKTIVLALPLGLGKANHIANALYAKAVADRSIKLTIFTALTLEPPRAKSELERRFLDPIAQRLFAGYPPLAYAAAIHNNQVPPNIVINEFFFEAGQWLGSPYAQQHYICANYTHALRYVLDRGVNVVAQLVAHRADEAPRAYSLSCNPDLTLDLLARRRGGGADFLFAGQTNSELPFMPGDAAIGENEFDLMLESAATDFPLFAAPREPVALADYAVGLHAASIVPDGGTLQIGIGSLGEAVAQALGAAPARQRRLPHAAVAARLRAGRRRRGARGKIRRRPLRLQRIVRRRHARSVPRRHPQARGRRHRAARRLLPRLARLLPQPARDAARGRQEIRHDRDRLRQRALSRRGQQAAGAEKRALPQRRHDGDRARRRDLRRPRRRPHRQRRRRAVQLHRPELCLGGRALGDRAARDAQRRRAGSAPISSGATATPPSRATCAT